MKRTRWTLCAAIALCIALWAERPYCQNEEYSSQAQPSSKGSAIRFTGELGAFGELYNMSGRADNRPSSTGRLFLRSTLTAWESISANLNFILSTEGNSARQNINQIDFNPKWRWGEAHLGDFSEEYTPLTLSGIRVRGGSFQIQPKGFRLGLVSGVTNRSVNTDTDRRSFERSITGGKVGIGSSQGSSFDLSFITARDRLSSIAPLVVDSTIDTAGIGIDSTQAPVTITPQENLVISAHSTVRAFKRRLTWNNEFSGSAITRDRRAERLDSDDIPAFLADIFTPRVSSSADYAFTTDLRIDLKKVALSAGYQYIGPGYVSLGVASLLPDRSTVTGGMQFRHSRGMVKLDGSYQTDNLIDQKVATTTRTRLSSVLTYRLARSWNANAAISLVGMENDAALSTSKVDYRSLMMRTGQTIAFSSQRGVKVVSLDYAYQHSDDPTPSRQTSRLTSHTVSLATTVAPTGGMDIIAAAGIVNTEAAGNTARLTQTYSLGLRLPELMKNLQLSPSMVIAVQDPNTSIRSAMRTTYRLTQALQFNGEFEMINYRGGAAETHFDETAARLTVSRSF